MTPRCGTGRRRSRLPGEVERRLRGDILVGPVAPPKAGPAYPSPRVPLLTWFPIIFLIMKELM